MKDYQRDFIDFLVAQQVLTFGTFTLKSGRVSPYFFNAGRFASCRNIALLGSFYATALVDSKLEFDCLFGPAYKGIPLVTALGTSLFRDHNRDYPFCFNRKEKKDHGQPL